jgi:hypothetical protein
MSEYRDAGQVKARLSGLFKAELGFMKSANLAGEMVTKHWSESRGDNCDQKVLSVLITSANALFSPFAKRDEVLAYLWCHQKVHRSIGFFSTVATSDDDRTAAWKWFLQKAEDFAEKTGQAEFLDTLRPRRRTDAP